MKLFLHHPPNNIEKPFSFRVLRLFRRKFLWMLRRVIHNRRKEHRASRRQRQPRPPMMNTLGMWPNPRHLVICRRVIDLWQRQRNFDKFFPHLSIQVLLRFWLSRDQIARTYELIDGHYQISKFFLNSLIGFSVDFP
jgi:hypothetical protein